MVGMSVFFLVEDGLPNEMVKSIRNKNHHKVQLLLVRHVNLYCCCRFCFDLQDLSLIICLSHTSLRHCVK